VATPAELVKRLREHFSISQEELAGATDGELDRGYISKIEIGHNKASSFKVRSALARAFGVSVSKMSGYLDGKESLENMIREAEPPSIFTGKHTTNDTPPPDLVLKSRKNLEQALKEVFNGKIHEFDDVDAVRSIMSGTTLLADKHPDTGDEAFFWIDDAAKALLDGAAWLREQHIEPDAQSLLIYMTQKLTGALEAIEKQKHARQAEKQRLERAAAEEVMSRPPREVRSLNDVDD
jgi:transcriptional regulator with XRE-family HTH domain